MIHDKFFVVRNGRQNDKCYNEIGLCVLNTNTIIGLVVKTIGMAYAITCLTLCDFFISTFDLKLGTISSMSCNPNSMTKSRLDRSNGPKLCRGGGWKVPNIKAIYINNILPTPE